MHANNEPRYTIGQREQDGRYPVTVDDRLTGHIYRWHGQWYAIPLGVTIESGHDDRNLAAAHLAYLFDAGAITANSTGTEPESSSQARELDLTTPRNITSAARALARLAELAWTPLAPYPGSDNPWPMTCGLCGWQGVRWWSHLRGRNGDNVPRPVNRHDGCIPIEQHAERISQLTETATVCLCSTSHPTTPDAAAELLNSVARARRAGHELQVRAHLDRLLGPCPASTTRAEALHSLTLRPKN
ncbi:hypothetical protein ACWCWD_29575 [Streptomyces sp. NPDC001493]